MAGTTSEIQLASNALLLLGHQPIAAFDEPTAGADVASNLFETSYRFMLTIHRWRFATKQAQLSRLTAAPTKVYRYQFQLPSDMLYLIRAINVRDYEIYEDKLYSNEQDIYIEYIYRVDAGAVPSSFAKAFEYYLASQFAIPITGDIDKASYFSQAYDKALIKAKYADSSQRPNQAFIDSPYIDVRS